MRHARRRSGELPAPLADPPIAPQPTHTRLRRAVLKRLTDAGLVKGKTIGIDATTLEANAALWSIVRRDTGAGYETFLRRLAAASDIATATRPELVRLNRKRPKKGSNDDSTHPHDPDAKITKMKDGRTHLAHMAEHAVDLETGVVVGITVQYANAGDTTTLVETLTTGAGERVEAVLPVVGPAEVVGDKGHHTNETLVPLADLGICSYVSRASTRGNCGFDDAPLTTTSCARHGPHFSASSLVANSPALRVGLGRG